MQSTIQKSNVRTVRIRCYRCGLVYQEPETNRSEKRSRRCPKCGRNPHSATLMQRLRCYLTELCRPR